MADSLHDFAITHPVEIVRHFDLAGHEAETTNFRRHLHTECHDHDHCLAGLCDLEWLAVRGSLDETRKMALGFVNAESVHDDRD